MHYDIHYTRVARSPVRFVQFRRRSGEIVQAEAIQARARVSQRPGRQDPCGEWSRVRGVGGRVDELRTSHSSGWNPSGDRLKTAKLPDSGNFALRGFVLCSRENLCEHIPISPLLPVGDRAYIS
jgi:hypothetical protein